ncbi:hypothetical protein SAMN02927900_02721 [Rhizobium mongolense subsp. loessense]|uniref:Uncharacterized protein n=1 Tax=Rhizobium mongolense subsp. loessense TaxID=158890 RepID=A0A1G4RIE9_9HYPH|nr:hypothetical protein [Rhizobium mongolense]SCW56580.1 hypothetical protein SAMN02927900_02721 [Rhizobium mongolense subsp. loessense]
MTEAAHSILDIFFAFRARQLQRTTWENTMRQMTALPSHLIADVDPYALNNTREGVTHPSASQQSSARLAIQTLHEMRFTPGSSAASYHRKV